MSYNSKDSNMEEINLIVNPTYNEDYLLEYFLELL